LAITALKAGLQVLCEKPLAVHKADCQRMIAVYKRTKGLVFGEMFNQRTDPYSSRFARWSARAKLERSVA